MKKKQNESFTRLLNRVNDIINLSQKHINEPLI